MENREKIITESDFFKDKGNLAKEIVNLEKKTKVYLPNNFDIRIKQNYQSGGRDISIGRLHSFYFFGLNSKEGQWKYQVFENEKKFKEFFVNLPNMEEKDISFWFREIKKLA